MGYSWDLYGFYICFTWSYMVLYEFEMVLYGESWILGTLHRIYIKNPPARSATWLASSQIPALIFQLAMQRRTPEGAAILNGALNGGLE